MSSSQPVDQVFGQIPSTPQQYTQRAITALHPPANILHKLQSRRIHSRQSSERYASTATNSHTTSTVHYDCRRTRFCLCLRSHFGSWRLVRKTRVAEGRSGRSRIKKTWPVAAKQYSSEVLLSWDLKDSDAQRQSGDLRENDNLRAQHTIHFCMEYCFAIASNEWNLSCGVVTARDRYLDRAGGYRRHTTPYEMQPSK